MILLTVGTQLPFDRLIELVDKMAEEMDEQFVAQIGRGNYTPNHMEWCRVMDPVAFEDMIASARLIISHAGIGTVVTAQRHGKPMILFPRLASLGEHRNDHQLATTSALAGRPGIAVATRPDELLSHIASPPATSQETSPPQRQHQLRQTIAQFIVSAIGEGSAR